MRKGLKMSILLLIILISIFAGFIGKDFLDKREKSSGKIMTSDVILEPIKYQLINKSVDQLVLDSNDIEAGYELNREDSGYKEVNGTEYFLKTFEKNQLNYNKSRNLLLETYKLKTEDEAKNKLEDIKKELFEEGYVNFASGEKSSFYEKSYFYDFVPLQNYVGIIRSKNVIFKISLVGYYGQVDFSEELPVYIKKSVEKANTKEMIYPEISTNKVLQAREDFEKVNISINYNGSSTDSVSMIKIDSGYIYKRSARLSICISNKGVEEGVYVDPENFIIKDNLGNFYVSYSQVEYNKKLISKLDLCQSYSFEIFAPERYEINPASLYFYNNGTLLDREIVNLDLLNEK